MDSAAHVDASKDLAAERDELRRELARAQAAIAELQNRDTHLRIAMQASQVVAYQWDIVNDRVTRMRGSTELGAALEDAGTFESVVAKVHPEDQATFRADIGAALASADGLFRTEVRYRRADGELRWLSETGRVMRGADQRPARMVGITFDITERKNAENALRAAQVLLREQGERKDEFLAMLAHELRNPLAPIRNATQILRNAESNAHAAQGARAMIERQVDHLVRLVDDLLDVSRVSRGRITLQETVLDLRDVARHALDVSRPLLTARGHALDVLLPPTPVPVRGDFIRLAQVLANLLNNAAKYTDTGGRVVLAVECAGGEAHARVSDNGRGLEAREREHVFELFYQVERDLDRSDGGLGLGLSLVKSLVELHGGSVSAESAGLAQGSTFCIRLPLANLAMNVTPAAAPAAMGRGPIPLRMLVVDDLRDSAESMAELLRLQGHEVATALDGCEAVEIALRERPDLVLLDIGLPKMNGYEACRAMRDGGLTQALIVAVTGYGQAEDRRRSQEAGFDEHLVKPVHFADVEALAARRR